ncbi:hypothetical protein MLD38_032950 [Melastoma candidum]|uniref:Uncharacterized protein n=1 Tax=Melastoma candidum TaxID=119954 RepID=A0ACB9M7S3_9MYRT|nr:hypothetical protein MLD38_032950 [Melastoma candidum]
MTLDLIVSPSTTSGHAVGQGYCSNVNDNDEGSENCWTWGSESDARGCLNNDEDMMSLEESLKNRAMDCDLDIDIAGNELRTDHRRVEPEPTVHLAKEPAGFKESLAPGDCKHPLDGTMSNPSANDPTLSANPTKSQTWPWMPAEQGATCRGLDSSSKDWLPGLGGRGIPLSAVLMVTPQHRRARSLDKQFPICLGKMVNLFDLSAGLTSNKLLTDRIDNPDGPTLSRSLSDMSMAPSSPSKILVDCKRTVSHTRRSSSGQKSSGTPMKALIAEEMSKDVETKHVRSNVIAKLMGLDALPQKQQPYLSAQKRQSSAPEFWDREHLLLGKELQSELLKFHDYKGCAEFREMLQQPNNPKTSREQPAQKGRRRRSKHEKKMDLVRQNFVDAKRLVTDEKLRHSREFQDALEMLSSNRELFLSFLQEPNSLFSGSPYEFQSLPREAEHITILRPSKVVDVDKLVKQPPLVVQPDILNVDDAECVHEDANENCEDCPPQPTRIVVLKPGIRKNDEMKTSILPCSQDSKFDEKLLSTEVNRGILCPVQENLASIRRDETLLSSVISNGYAGDDNSFYKSESEAIGNLSDSEVTSTPRHSWDFVNKVGSPRSLSSFSRASYSPESSVCREAKKRLSERWALMSSHHKSQESRHARTDSGTLGEMLSLMDTKESVMPERDTSGKEQQLIGSTLWSVSDSNKEEEALVESPKRLVRSKSVPVSSSYSATLLTEATDAGKLKPDEPKEAAKKVSVNSSFKGRVSSLFFFRSRKSSKEKSSKSQPKMKNQSTTVDTPGNLSDERTDNSDDATVQVNSDFLQACSSPSCNQSPLEDAELQQHRSSAIHEVGSSVMPDSKGNQDHPSPISVLDPSFEEDDNLTSESSGGQAPVLPHRFNLIDKSPPIGSIARTLSWDDSTDEASAPYLSKLPNVSPVMEERLDWLAFIQTLICEAGFDGQLSFHSFISRWYSAESPLDPSLREKFENGTTMPEGKCRQRRSERKLAFDAVNLALVRVTGCCGSSWSLIDRPYDKVQNGSEPSTLSMIADCVWAQMKEWFSDEFRCVYIDDGDINEAVGKGWIENFGLEMDCVGRDIEMKLLGELVDEAVKDQTGRL